MILLNHPLIYFTFYILLILLRFFVEVKSQKTIGLRVAHTATYINDKIYILGGAVPTPPGIMPYATKSPFLGLDVPFNTNELKWTDLSGALSFAPQEFAAAIKGVENNTLLLYGGRPLNGVSTSLVYAYDTQNDLWSALVIKGAIPTESVGVTLVADYNGLIYIFGGFSSEGYSNHYTNNMFILDSVNFVFRIASSIDAPSPRAQYGAVILPNQSIIYMGGFSDIGRSTLNEVYLYDTINDSWTTKETTGSIPSARDSFSIVLGLDGQRVILFGGLEDTSTTGTSIYVLNISNFNWYIPKVTGNLPSNRASHKAVLIEKYMVITFGTGYTQGNESDILLLDISNNDEYFWTTTFGSSPPTVPLSSPVSSSSPTTQSNTNNNVGAIIGTSVASFFILSALGSFFLYRWFKNKDEQKTKTSTSNIYFQKALGILQNPGKKADSQHAIDFFY